MATDRALTSPPVSTRSPPPDALPPVLAGNSALQQLSDHVLTYPVVSEEAAGGLGSSRAIAQQMLANAVVAELAARMGGGAGGG